MEIYVVQAEDTLYSIAQKTGVGTAQLMYDNQPPNPTQLCAGQTLVIRTPAMQYTVRPWDTFSDLLRRTGLSARQLYRNNPSLGGIPVVHPGQTLVLQYTDPPGPTIESSSYAYPFIDRAFLQEQLPFLSAITPFTYGITKDGDLVPLDDESMIRQAYSTRTAPIMHLSTLSEEGGFSSTLAETVLSDEAIQQKLISRIMDNIFQKGYLGLDVDFEFLPAQYADDYATFLQRLKNHLTPYGYPVITALAPKTSATQRGLLYEGHNYHALGNAVDRVLLMTYEWGYTYGPPMAVAPLPNVRTVLEYALTEIPPEKIWLGIPTYGYDWPLPFQQGKTQATSLSPQEAISLATKHKVEIQYSQTSQAPWFRYTNEEGVAHEVWFEDARSIQAKLGLVTQYKLAGVGYWNSMREFPQNWVLLDSLFTILPER